MFIDEYLDELARDVTPTDTEFNLARARAERYGQVLIRDRSMGVRSFIIGGSCGKLTATRPIQDVDLFVVLEDDAFRRGDGRPLQPGSVLRAFQERLDVTIGSYAGTVSTRLQYHSVRLVHSGERSTDVEVVPAVVVGRGVVEIPERGSRVWIRTSIEKQLDLLDRLDVRNRAVRRTIRLLKFWRDQHYLRVRSYALEVLALVAAHEGVPRHPSKLFIAALLRLAETELRSAIAIGNGSRDQRYGIYDPAVPNNNLTDNLDAADRRALVSRARRSAEALLRACDYAEDGRRAKAEERVLAAFGIS